MPASIDVKKSSNAVKKRIGSNTQLAQFAWSEIDQMEQDLIYMPANLRISKLHYTLVVVSLCTNSHHFQADRTACSHRDFDRPAALMARERSSVRATAGFFKKSKPRSESLHSLSLLCAAFVATDNFHDPFDLGAQTRREFSGGVLVGVRVLPRVLHSLKNKYCTDEKRLHQPSFAKMKLVRIPGEKGANPARSL